MCQARKWFAAVKSDVAVPRVICIEIKVNVVVVYSSSAVITPIVLL